MPAQAYTPCKAKSCNPGLVRLLLLIILAQNALKPKKNRRVNKRINSLQQYRRPPAISKKMLNIVPATTAAVEIVHLSM